MKRRAIKAELRKESESFPGWLKYEVTIQEEDGKIIKIPAYGKDLHDAMSRIGHDERMENISRKLTYIPEWIWPVTWFAYLFVIGFIFRETGNYNVLSGGFAFAVIIGLVFLKLFQKRNISK